MTHDYNNDLFMLQYIRIWLMKIWLIKVELKDSSCLNVWWNLDVFDNLNAW